MGTTFDRVTKAGAEHKREVATSAVEARRNAGGFAVGDMSNAVWILRRENDGFFAMVKTAGIAVLRSQNQKAE